MMAVRIPLPWEATLTARLEGKLSLYCSIITGGLANHALACTITIGADSN